MIVHLRRPCSTIALLALALSAPLAGCSSAHPGAPASADLGAFKTLYVGTPFAVAERSNGGGHLFVVDGDDAVREIEFRDTQGRPSPVEVLDVRVLSAAWVWLHLAPGVAKDGPSPAHALLRVSDGKLFDAEALSAGGTPQLRRGDVLSAIAMRADGSSAVARLDLTSMELQYLGTTAAGSPGSKGARFVVDRDGNVRALASTPESGLPRQTIFFADGGAPVVDSWGPDQADPAFCETAGGGGTLALTHGTDDGLYAFCVSTSVSVMSPSPDPEGVTTFHPRQYFVREVRFTPTGSQFVDQAPAVSSPCPVRGAFGEGGVCAKLPLLRPADDLRARTHRVGLGGGFFSLAPEPGGGLSVAWTTLSRGPDASGSIDEFQWWSTGPIVFRSQLRTGGPEAVSSFYVRGPWRGAGSVLVYCPCQDTRCSTGETYAVKSSEASPALVASTCVLPERVDTL